MNVELIGLAVAFLQFGIIIGFVISRRIRGDLFSSEREVKHND